MNIVIVSTMFLPSYGGVERYGDNLAKSLAAQGHSVTLLTANPFRLPEMETLYEGVTVRRIPCVPFLKGRLPITFRFRSKPFLEALKEESVDMALIQTRFYPLCLQASRSFRKNGIPFAILDHGSDHIAFNVPAVDWVVRHYEHAITSCVKKYCTDFYGVSLASCDWLKHFGITAKGPLYNSIDGKAITAIAEKAEKDRPKSASGEPTVITYTGRLIPQKGVQKLISAVSSLLESGENVVLNIAGDGPQKKLIESLTTERIRYLGQLSWEEVIRLLAASHIFVLPSESEGFPTSVLEAAACGCYVITTENGGAKELITSPEYGCILPEATDDNLEETLRSCLHDPEAYRKAAEKTKTLVLSEFTWDRTAERLIEIAKAKKNKE